MTVSDFVAESVRHARKTRVWRTADLAARCKEVGASHLTENVIENIESRSQRGGTRHPRPVTVDELFDLAEALGCLPLDLLPRLPCITGLMLTGDEIRCLQAILGRVSS